jgi:transcription antitermination factor NusG
MELSCTKIANRVGVADIDMQSHAPRWYAAYTCAQHEKSVATQLDARGLTHYLPLYKTLRRWSDRRKVVHLPLFAGYVFVRMELRNRLDVLQLPGVVRLVGFNAGPIPLEDGEIEGLRQALEEGVRAEPYPYLHLSIGRRVRIVAGPLAGREGVLKRWKGAVRVVLSLELIQSSILVDVDATSIEPVSSSVTSARA